MAIPTVNIVVENIIEYRMVYLTMKHVFHFSRSSKSSMYMTKDLSAMCGFLLCFLRIRLPFQLITGTIWL